MEGALLSRQAHFLLRIVLVKVFILNSLNARRMVGFDEINKYAQLQVNVNMDKRTTNIPTEESKRQMLNVLGMDELPELKNGASPHQYMIQIYKKMSRRRRQANGVNTIRGFVDIGKDDAKREIQFHQTYEFNISALPITERLISADLRILRLPTGMEWKYAYGHGMRYRAKIYYKKHIHHMWNGFVYSHTQLIFLDSMVFDVRDRKTKDWKVFKVLDALNEWRNDSNFVHSLELQVESIHSGYLVPGFAFGFSEKSRAHNQHALLVSYSDDGKTPMRSNEASSERQKSKRSKNEKIVMKNKNDEGGNRSKRGAKRRRRRKLLCHRRNLYIDFALLGWAEWIITPRGYNAYYCRGVCRVPIPEHLNPTNHAMVQSTVHDMDRRRVPPVCCIPDKLSRVSLLFYDKGDSVVYKTYDNMVVESCRCK